MALTRPITLAGILLCGLTGCVTISVNTGAGPMSKDTPCRVAVRWINEVRFAPDTTRGGELTPGLVGRVYLFGKDIGRPIEGDGGLHVELADASQTPPKTLEQWDIPADKAALFKRKDAIGSGYSLFLPWATYRPELKCIQMKLAYQPKQGAALFATPDVVKLVMDEVPQAARSAARSPTAPPVPVLPMPALTLPSLPPH